MMMQPAVPPSRRVDGRRGTSVGGAGTPRRWSRLSGSWQCQSYGYQT